MFFCCLCSDKDLLGDYEFNPFVDEVVELDYDENMEEEEGEEVEEGEEGEESSDVTKEEDEEEEDGDAEKIGQGTRWWEMDWGKST